MAWLQYFRITTFSPVWLMVLHRTAIYYQRHRSLTVAVAQPKVVDSTTNITRKNHYTTVENGIRMKAMSTFAM